MPSADHLRRHLLLYRRRKLQQTQRVRYLRTRPRDPLRKFVLGRSEIGHELLICARLFERIELRTMQVLQQGIAEQIPVLGLSDDGRDGRLPRQLRGTQTPLAHDEFVARARLLGDKLLELS